MKVLVLGGSGYIGSHLLRRLGGMVGVTCVAAARGRWAAVPGIATMQLDTRDEAALTRALAGMDCLINCVAGDASSIANGAATLVRAARAAGCERIVHLSSMAVYGRQEGTLDEGAPFDASLGWYAQAKCAAEREIEHYADGGGNAVTLRPGCVYGQDSPLWVGRIGRLLRAGRLGDLGAGGDGWSNLVHVDDVCTAIVAALHMTQSQHSGHAPKLEAFNLAAPDSPRWNDYFRDLALAIGATPFKRIPPRQIKTDAFIAGPVIKITAGLADRLGVDRHGLPDPIPPALLRFFAQQVKLDSRKAEQGLGLRWTSYQDGILDSVRGFLKAA